MDKHSRREPHNLAHGPWFQEVPDARSGPRQLRTRASTRGMSAASMQTSVIVVGGLSLHVQVQGEGPPVLLLNGLGQPLESWDPFVAALRGRRVIRFDAPRSEERRVGK